MTTEGLSMRNLLRRMVEKGASDLHLTAGAPPCFRIDGAIVPERSAPLAPHDAQSLVYAVLDDQQKAEFERTNLHRRRGELHAAPYGLVGLAHDRDDVADAMNGLEGVDGERGRSEEDDAWTAHAAMRSAGASTNEDRRANAMASCRKKRPTRDGARRLVGRPRDRECQLAMVQFVPSDAGIVTAVGAVGSGFAWMKSTICVSPM
jgi:hypothetical protein